MSDKWNDKLTRILTETLEYFGAVECQPELATRRSLLCTFVVAAAICRLTALSAQVVGDALSAAGASLDVVSSHTLETTMALTRNMVLDARAAEEHAVQ